MSTHARLLTATLLACAAGAANVPAAPATGGAIRPISVYHAAPTAQATTAAAGPDAPGHTLSAASGARTHGCLAAGNGYLRARIRGALHLDIDWRNAELECEGEARPGGNGIRLSFAGPLHGGGRLRMVFGVGGAAEGRTGRDLPTNLTLIVEGRRRMFTTHGAGRCTVGELRQMVLGHSSGTSRTYRVVARGFCVAPADAIIGSGHIVVNRFDFAGRVAFHDPHGS